MELKLKYRKSYNDEGAETGILLYYITDKGEIQIVCRFNYSDTPYGKEGNEIRDNYEKYAKLFCTLSDSNVAMKLLPFI